jgi:hypothetical protein
METFLTRVMTIVALTCFLVVGAAATSILGRDSLPMPQFLAAAAPADRAPVSNRESKKDRLAVATPVLTAFEPPQTQVQDQVQDRFQVPSQVQTEVRDPELAASLRRAYASTSPADIGLPKLNEPATAPATAAPAVEAAPKPKAVNKPQPQKNYALLSDAQIAGIKERLKLSSSQESYWPAVETALRGIARKIHATRQGNPTVSAAQIDPDSEEVQQLKSAAMPLLFQLREDQKREVRSLARLIGLEKVAAMI